MTDSMGWNRCWEADDHSRGDKVCKFPSGSIPEGNLLCSQERTKEHNPESQEKSEHPYTLILKNPL
jgi:hypothetical protein